MIPEIGHQNQPNMPFCSMLNLTAENLGRELLDFLLRFVKSKAGIRSAYTCDRLRLLLVAAAAASINRTGTVAHERASALRYLLK